MFYVLRNQHGQLFAGFRPAMGKLGIFIPVFVTPGAGKSVQANVIHEDDVAETERDLRKDANLHNMIIERVKLT